MSARKAFFDTVAVSFVSAFRLLAQFIAVPILSRLLSPSDYGLVAMAMPFLLFAMVIADAGIGVSLVRTPAGERHVWSTCFWLSLMLGAGLAAIMMVAAPFFAMLFEERRLQPIVMVLGVAVFIQSLSAIPTALLQREQKFRLLARTEVVALALGIFAAIAIALCGGGAWALVARQLVFHSLRAGLNFWFTSFRPGKIFDMPSVKEHLVFGRDMLGVNVILFLSRSIDNLVIGKIITVAAVGVYAMAFQFARLPMMLISGPLQYVFYAKLVNVKDDIQALRGTFLFLTRLLAILIFPAMGMVAVAHEPIFALLLSEKWAASGRVFMLAAAGCALQAVMGIGPTIRMVLGRTDYQFRAAVESGVLWLLALFISAEFGLEWVAIAYSVAFIAYAPRSLSLTLPLIGCSAFSYWRTMIIPGVVTGLCITVYSIFSGGAWTDVCFAAGLAIIGLLVSAFFQRRELAEGLRFLNRLVSV